MLISIEMDALGMIFKEEKRFNDVSRPENQVRRVETGVQLEAQPCSRIAVATLQTEVTHEQCAAVRLPVCVDAQAHAHRTAVRLPVFAIKAAAAASFCTTDMIRKI